MGLPRGSLFKYPTKLYKYQKKYLLPQLEKQVRLETKEWGNIKRTVACEIMDISDRISYGTSDIVDSFITGYTKKTMPKFFKDLSKKVSSNRLSAEILKLVSEAAKNNSKRLVRKHMLELKKFIINDLFWNKEKGTLDTISNDTFYILDSIVDYTKDQFIDNKEVIKERNLGIKYLNKYTKFFLKYPKKMPSGFFFERYKSASNKLDKLRAIRDMVGDSSDQFVIKFVEKNIIK